MAKRAKVALAPEVPVPYFVYDRSVEDKLGNAKITMSGKERIVIMTRTQAQYWLDHGTIGLKSLSERSDAAQEIIGQLANGRTKDDADVTPLPGKIAVAPARKASEA